MICDIQTEYADCLFKALTERFAGEYQFHLFQDAEKMREFISLSRAGILVIGEEFETGVYEDLPAEKVFILTEKRGKEKEDGQAFLFRYQSADVIAGDIRAELGKETINPVRSAAKKKSGKNRIRAEPGTEAQVRGLIGVYSPVHRIGKTRFAIRMGQRMARQAPVLYLNLEGYSGGSLYFDSAERQDLGDLIYCLKQERTDYGLKISSMTGQTGGMDYIMPMKNELDLRAVTCEEWMSLLDLITEKCVYETVILDLGDCIDGLYDILRRCDKIYTPYIGDDASLAKLEQYEANLRLSGNEEILRRTVKRPMQRKKAPERGNSPDDEDRAAL